MITAAGLRKTNIGVVPLSGRGWAGVLGTQSGQVLATTEMDYTNKEWAQDAMRVLALASYLALECQG